MHLLTKSGSNIQFFSGKFKIFSCTNLVLLITNATKNQPNLSSLSQAIKLHTLIFIHIDYDFGHVVVVVVFLTPAYSVLSCTHCLQLSTINYFVSSSAFLVIVLSFALSTRVFVVCFSKVSHSFHHYNRRFNDNRPTILATGPRTLLVYSYFHYVRHRPRDVGALRDRDRRPLSRV